MIESGAIAFFGGITARGDQFDGPGWYFTDLIGMQSMKVDMDVIRRAGTHGIYALPAYMRERVVRLPGFHVARDHTKLEDASRRLQSLLTQKLALVVEGVNGPRRVQGTVTGAAFDNHGFAPEGTWELEVTCPLPWIYGERREAATGVPAVQMGTVAATPRLLIGAGTGGYTITGPGGRQIVVPSPPAGAHEINFDEGGLFVGGDRQIGAMTVFQPWSIPAGLTGAVATISGSRSMRQRFYDTSL